MKQEFLKLLGMEGKAIAVLILFVTLFVIGIVLIFRKKSKKKYDSISKLPLQDDEDKE